MKKHKIKISTKNKIAFLENLADMINSWIPISNAIQIIYYQSKNKSQKKLSYIVMQDLSKWISLKESFSSIKKIFNDFDISIVGMWEMTWKLWEALDIIKDKEVKNKELKWKIIWALIYPMILIVLSLSMIVVFMLYVIPKIQGMYKDARVNLPDLTLNVIATSDFLRENIIIISWFIVFIIIFVLLIKSIKKTKIYYDKFILKIPIIWRLIKKKIISLFARNLWILLSSSILINKSLEITKTSLENDYYSKNIDEIISWVSSWESLSNLLWINMLKTGKEHKLFPIDLASIVKIWEQTWKMPSLLLKISDKYNKEIDNEVANINTIIEPTVIILMWIVIWTIIMAILLPFFNMVKVI